MTISLSSRVASSQLYISEQNQRHTYYLGLLGDSHTNNGFYTDGTSPDGSTPPAYFVSSGTTNSARGWGWASWVGPLSMQRIQVVKSWARQSNGVLAAGTTPVGWPLSRQISQAQADPLWSLVNRAVILIGTNDVAFSIADWTAELLTQIKRIEKPVDLISIPPISSGVQTAVGGDSLAGWAWIMEANAVCKRIADSSGGRVRFINAYPTMNTPTTVPDGWATNYSYDTIHGSNLAAYQFADSYAQSLLPSGIGSDLDVWHNAGYASSTNASNLDQGFQNPCFATGTGGTGTGTIAGSITVTNIGTATHNGSVSANTMTGGSGNMQTIAITSNASGDGVDISSSTSMHNVGTTFVTAGDSLWFQAMVRVNSGGIYPRNMFTRLLGFQNPTNYSSVLFELDAAKEYALPLTETRTFLLRTPILVVPSGSGFSSLLWKMRITFAGAGSCTVDVGNPDTRRFKSSGVYI